MTLKEENESYAGSFAAGLGDDADDGTAGGSGGGVTTGGNAFSSGFGSVKTPMYFKSVPTPKTTAVSPYGNFIDSHRRRCRRHYHRHHAAAAKTTAGRPSRPLRE